MKFLLYLSGSVNLCDLSLSPRRHSISRGKTGRRTWFGQEETAANTTMKNTCSRYELYNCGTRWPVG